MIAIDWVLLVLIAGSALFGLMRGMIGVLASLAAWLLAGWAAFQFGAEVALVLAGGGEPGPGHLFGGYALAFIVVMVVVGVVGWMLRKLVHSVGLSGLDRMLGFVLGIARGVVVACALLLLLGLTELPREPSWRTSRLVPLLLPGSEQMRTWLPDWVAAQVDIRGEGDGPALLSPDMASSLPRPIGLPSLPGVPDPAEEPSPDHVPTSDVPTVEVPLPAPVRTAPSKHGDRNSVIPANGD